MAKKEILNYSSILPEKKKTTTKREVEFIPVTAPKGSRKDRNRVGRGRSAGQGKTAGRGQKGQKSRAGFSRRAGFEGGQMPLHRRLPKRGFTSVFKKEFQLVNLYNLAGAGLTGDIGPADLQKAGLIDNADKLIKILGQGEITAALNITADAFSESAKTMLGEKGGSAIIRERKKAEAKSE